MFPDGKKRSGHNSFNFWPKALIFSHYNIHPTLLAYLNMVSLWNLSTILLLTTRELLETPLTFVPKFFGWGVNCVLS